MPLFTGKGDQGDSQFFGHAARTKKSDCQFEALGAVDEVNSLIGVCRAVANRVGREDIGRSLRRIQDHLFIIQAELAVKDLAALTIRHFRMRQQVNWRG